MNQLKAVTKTVATRYKRSSRGAKKIILDELCAITLWHRDHARKALREVLVVRKVKPRPPRPLLYDKGVIEALRFCWAVQGTPCWRLLAAALIDLVPQLGGFDELHITNATADKLLTIAPQLSIVALKQNEANSIPGDARHTKPGSLLKDSIPMRTWADSNDSNPRIVEIGLVGYEDGDNSRGDFCFTLDITAMTALMSSIYSIKSGNRSDS